MERNFVKYTDNDALYDVSDYAQRQSANSSGFGQILRQFISPLETTLNEGINTIGSWINSYIGLGNDRRKDEQGYYLQSDQQKNQQTGEIAFIIIIVLLIGGLIFIIKKKRVNE